MEYGDGDGFLVFMPSGTAISFVIAFIGTALLSCFSPSGTAFSFVIAFIGTALLFS
jgi:uncharacterized membrane protein YeaQ/YmgE (transglycosylase-associated protein family)